MKKMTTWERVSRMYQHKEADMVPMMDYPWDTTLERWYREGLPEGINYVDYFDLDRFGLIYGDYSPQYPEEVIEETDDYTIVKTSWGATLKNWRHIASTPEFLDFKITGPEEWAAAKARMVPTDDRIPWAYLKKEYPKWRKEGAWITAGFWFGFDVTHSWAVGTERVLTAMALNPEWCADMFSHYLEMCIALMEKVWQAGYEFDSISWPDDMGYKYKQFFLFECIDVY